MMNHGWQWQWGL